jgi:hypothetical protein
MISIPTNAEVCAFMADLEHDVIGVWKWAKAPCTRRIERKGASYVMYSWCEGQEKEEGELLLVSLGPQRYSNAIRTMTYEISSDGYLIFIDHNGHTNSVWSPVSTPCSK